MRVRASTQAERDLSAIRRYIAADSPRAEDRVIAQIRSATEKLADFPEMGRSGEQPGTREWVVGKLPYILICEIDSAVGELVILNVFHGAQNRIGR